MPDVFEDEKVKKSRRGARSKRFSVRSIIKCATIAHYRPDEIRDMIPPDKFLVFDGWNETYSRKQTGSEAASLEEARELARRYG